MSPLRRVAAISSLAALGVVVLALVYADIENMTTTLRSEYATLQGILDPIRLTKLELLGLFLRKTVHDIQLEWQATPQQIRSAVTLASTTLMIWGFITLLFSPQSTTHEPLSSRLEIPVFKRPKGVNRWDYEAILQHAKQKYPDTPYIITYSGYEYIVYPSSSYDEVKRLSMSHASLIDWATHVFFQGWQFLGKDNSVLHKVIAGDVWRAIPGTVHVRQRNAQRAVRTALGLTKGGTWKSKRLYSTVQDIIVRTNAATFMGPDLGDSRLWLWAVQLLPMVCMVAVFVCHGTPLRLRPFVAFVVFFPAWCIYWCMELLVLRKVWREAREFNGGQGRGNGGQGLKITSEYGEFPITKWLMGRYPSENRSLRQIGRDYINIAFESTMATAATLYFIVAELAARPELVRELREELLMYTDEDGKLPQTGLGELAKLDSFMRETSRLYTFSYLALYRRVSQPLKLSIGPELPPGSIICVDAYDLTMSTSRWKEPQTFDPMRFYNLRKLTQNGDNGEQPAPLSSSSTRYEFTSLGSDNPGFGDGPQACPGRGFAGNTIKIILCELLLKHDIALDPNAVKPMRHSMPNGSFAPDMWARLLFKERMAPGETE